MNYDPPVARPQYRSSTARPTSRHSLASQAFTWGFYVGLGLWLSVVALTAVTVVLVVLVIVMLGGAAATLAP